jgi:hypothetical protein
MAAKVEKEAIERASELEQKQLEADADEIERDASAAASQPDQVSDLLATATIAPYL